MGVEGWVEMEGTRKKGRTEEEQRKERVERRQYSVQTKGRYTAGRATIGAREVLADGYSEQVESEW